MVAPPCYIEGMKDQKPALNPDDIELHPDAWDRFVKALKQVARHPPVEKPKPKPTRRRSAAARFASLAYGEPVSSASDCPRVRR
jgi:hypothetical protein